MAHDAFSSDDLDQAKQLINEVDAATPEDGAPDAATRKLVRVLRILVDQIEELRAS
ncbi:hypothetical protein [Microbacterium sp. JZ31]|uniref:hypothetical protein n=1 Tax=Microbacterium sp. JZ31 TaxID=1906274 RepID=UPI00193493BD|nr:hypothetical protein [Microbacterium sp. JZ31]